MKEVLLENFVTLALVFGFLILLKTGNVFDKKVEKLFALAAICEFALIFIDAADSSMAERTTVNELRYVSSALGYTVRPIALGVFISILLRKRESIIKLWIPIFIVAFFALTNYWTHWMFKFDTNNAFVRGPLGYLPHLLSIGYTAALIYYTVRHINSMDSGEVITVFYISASCTAALIFETFFGGEFLLTGVIICALTVYYTYLYVQVYKTDPVTGVFNRICFNNDTEKRMNKKLGIICVDLNSLKEINDSKGHEEGDLALRTVSKILVNATVNKFRVYRMGGDEFFIIGVNANSNSMINYIKRANAALLKTNYSASFGYSEYTPGNDFQEACVEADKNMYEDKSKHKEHNN